MTPLELQFAAHRMLALAPRVNDADEAVRAEFDEGRVICRDCLTVMDEDESGGWQEGVPRCRSCWRIAVDDKADFDHGGEA